MADSLTMQASLTLRDSLTTQDSLNMRDSQWDSPWRRSSVQPRIFRKGHTDSTLPESGMPSIPASTLIETATQMRESTAITLLQFTKVLQSSLGLLPVPLDRTSPTS